MSINFHAIGQRIQKKRKSQNITQENLAEVLSVTVGYISQIERGITKINLETLSLIAEYLHCDITEFLSDTVKMSSNYLNEDFSSIIKNLSPYNRQCFTEKSVKLSQKIIYPIP